MTLRLRTFQPFGGHDVTDDLRQQFDPLVPALLARASALLECVPEPHPTATELVERVFRSLCTRRNVADIEATARRQLDAAIDNVAIRTALRAGHFDAGFARLQPRLERWALSLSRGLPWPRPDIADLVHDAFLKLQNAPMFREVDSPIGYANRVMKNLVVDVARKRVREVVAEIDERALPASSLEMSMGELERVMEKSGLGPQERCMVTRVVFEQLAVPKAQRECGGPAGEAYYVFDKILDKLAVGLGIDRNTRRGQP